MAPSFAQVAISVLCIGTSVFADSDVFVAPKLETRYADVLETRVVKAAALQGTWTYQGQHHSPFSAYARSTNIEIYPGIILRSGFPNLFETSNSRSSLFSLKNIKTHMLTF
jgi:hypothetical protein